MEAKGSGLSWGTDKESNHSTLHSDNMLPWAIQFRRRERDMIRDGMRRSGVNGFEVKWRIVTKGT